MIWLSPLWTLLSSVALNTCSRGGLSFDPASTLGVIAPSFPSEIFSNVQFSAALFHFDPDRWLEPFWEGYRWRVDSPRAFFSIKLDEDGLEIFEVRSPILNVLLLVLRVSLNSAPDEVDENPGVAEILLNESLEVRSKTREPFPRHVVYFSVSGNRLFPERIHRVGDGTGVTCIIHKLVLIVVTPRNSVEHFLESESLELSLWRLVLFSLSFFERVGSPLVWCN